MLPVVEKFVSINGEGAHAGELAAFIRFRGCNLDCSYCDTSWANCENASAEYETAEEIAEWVAEKGVENVTLTGGEPLLHKECGKVAELLMKQGCRVEIETNGSIHLEKLAAAEYRPVFTMDYKLPSSGMEEYMCRDNFRLLGEHDTVKFVSGSMEDLEKAAEIIRDYKLIGRCHVYISPVFGEIDPADIVTFMEENKLNGVRLQLQLHKFIWEPTRRGV
ncbi:putative 7-carboxy-7-deazaguanine synthase QueE [Ruminococcus flavefaciens]|uniref:putative 7-carboxy-7-deazaguanine synthase QueE n=1 Tax=Ruminococcus flavefaciens TaxID=1265 RepID=UPI0026EEE2C1|nr:putative 7-carboxy-7-deazaguanine synthase QueE [Ruminococcus flavefaciens]MDD7516491.1 putative 7-carboxy-7-deazaguanine synthase QueE [Ruminococcus flavefaciens]MDY5690765.1 putative 7-carboxy-7-deazaguanine synthase QueE [Ruminococcus flavefaciens]